MARWCPPPWRSSRIHIRTIGRTGRIRGGSRTTTRRTMMTTMRRPRYDGLRQRYLALLVPVIARINRELSGRGASRQRAAAVRRAIDTCLLRAASSSSSITMDPISQNPNNLLKKPLQKMISNPLHTPPSPIQAAPSSKMHISRVKRLCPTLLNNPNSCDLSRRWRKESFHGMAHGGSTIIPSQEELRKLQSVLICPSKFESINRRPAYCNLMSATGLIPPSLGTNDNDYDQISLTKDTNKDYDYGKSSLNLGLGSFVSQYSAAIIEEDEEEEEAEHEESNEDALSIIGTDTNTNTDRDINPVIVLTQAAQHILALQFQVDALQALLAD